MDKRLKEKLLICPICNKIYKTIHSFKLHLKYERRHDKALKEARRYYQKNKLRIKERIRLYHKKYDKTEQAKLSVKRRTYTAMEKYPEKYKARYTLRNAVAKGIIERKPCIVCGNPKSHGHHEDYSKPLEVIWLCHQHHCELEGRWIK
jgi:hypothetical protein